MGGQLVTIMARNNNGNERRRRGTASALCLGVSLALGGAAHAQEAFNLDELIAAAKKEKPITVYAVTG